MSDLVRRVQRILRAKLAALAVEHPREEFVGEAFDSTTSADPSTTSADPSTTSADPSTTSADPNGQGGAGVGRAAAVERARALAVLELAPGTTPDEIRSAYRRLCRRYHPDRFANDGAKSRAAHELFLEIRGAYELLTAPESSA